MIVLLPIQALGEEGGSEQVSKDRTSGNVKDTIMQGWEDQCHGRRKGVVNKILKIEDPDLEYQEGQGIHIWRE